MEPAADFRDHHHQYCCICCESPVFRDNEDENRLSSTFSEIAERSQGPGSSTGKSSALLQDQFLFYFIVKKLLKCEDEQVLDLLGCLEGVVKRKKQEEGHHLNRFCEKCQDIVREALETHRKMMTLQKKLNEMGEMLRQIVRLGRIRREETTDTRGYAVGTVTKKIQSFIMSDFKKRGNDDEFTETEESESSSLSFKMPEEGIKLEADLSNDSFGNVKMEEDQDRFMTGDSFDNDDDFDYLPEEEEQASLVEKTTKIKGKKRVDILKSNRKATDSTKSASVKGQPRRGGKCYICGMVQKTGHGFKNHLQAHETSSKLYQNKYDCPKCQYPALSEIKLRFHMTKMHQETQNNTCSLCGYVGDRRNKYEKHMLEKHNITIWTPIDSSNPIEKPESRKIPKTNDDSHLFKHVCTICGHRMRRLDQLKLHMLRKHNPTPSKERKSKWGKNKVEGRFQCDLCKYTYADSGALRRHMEEHQKSDDIGRKWECQKCGFPCLSDSKLNRHNLLKHEEGRHTCKTCQKEFRSLTRLQVHILRHKQHDNYFDATTGLFSCHSCPSQFKSLQSLILHSAQRHDNCLLETAGVPEELSHLCSQCGRRFTTSLQLQRHVKTKHEQSWTHFCDVCGKGLLGKGMLKEHRKSHIKNRAREHVCEICGTAYSAKGTLTKHMEKHHSSEATSSSAQKSCQCKFCHSTFPFKYLLEKHMKSVHQDRYVFKCDLCPDKSYISGGSLRLHQQITHKLGGTSETNSCEFCGKQFAHKHYVTCHYKACSVKRQLTPEHPVKLDQP